MSGNTALEADDDLPVVCPHCLTSNAIGQHFCRRCGTPLTGLAVTDPLGQVYSEGDALRKAIDKPDRPLILVGMWLMWGPTFLACLVLIGWFVVAVSTEPFGPPGAPNVWEAVGLVALFVLFVVGLAVISGTMLFRTTRNYARLRRARRDKSRRQRG